MAKQQASAAAAGKTAAKKKSCKSRISWASPHQCYFQQHHYLFNQ